MEPKKKSWGTCFQSLGLKTSSSETQERKYILDHTNAKDCRPTKKRFSSWRHAWTCPYLWESWACCFSEKTELSLTSGLYSAIIRLSNSTHNKCSTRITSAFQWANGKQPFKPVSWWTTRSVLRAGYDLTAMTAMQHFSTLFTTQGQDNHAWVFVFVHNTVPPSCQISPPEGPTAHKLAFYCGCWLKCTSQEPQRFRSKL